MCSPTAATLPSNFKDLGADARFFASSMFSMMAPGQGRLTFRMVENKPSPRSQAALDELVAAGLIKAEPFNNKGGITYTPLFAFPRVELDQAAAGAWPITVTIGADANA